MVSASKCTAEPTVADVVQHVGVTLTVNGQLWEQEVEACATVLDVLHDGLGLFGAKRACDMGACGACTVLADGRRIVSCLALAASYERAEIVTIEGVGEPTALHPMQEAFIRHDALQCGYCTPGQIMSAIAVIGERPVDAPAVREAMSGNLCRCGAYPNIVAAIVEVAEL